MTDICRLAEAFENLASELRVMRHDIRHWHISDRDQSILDALLLRSEHITRRIERLAKRTP